MNFRLAFQVSGPALIFVSIRDKHVEPGCGQIILDGISSSQSELVTLYNSGHSMLIDVEHVDVFRRSYGFIKRHSRVLGTPQHALPQQEPPNRHTRSAPNRR